MAPFKHAFMAIATDFELEPVIEQYLTTYPEIQPRQYNIVWKAQAERHAADYCYLIVYEYVPGRIHPRLDDFIKAYCELHDRVAAINPSGHVFPDLAKPTYGNPTRYQQKRQGDGG